MKERSAFDILLDYPKEKGLVVENHESYRRYYLTPNDPFLNTKYIVFKKDALIYLAYDSYAAKAFMNKTFTGVYCVIDLEPEFECKINRRMWLDPFIRKNIKKMGVKYIDNNFTMEAKSELRTTGWFNEKTAKLLFDLQEKIQPTELIIQNDYLPIVEEFKGKKIIGLETNQWIYKKEEVDMLLNLGGEIITNILKHLAKTM